MADPEYDCPHCRRYRARIAELEARVRDLEAQFRDLLDKLKPPPPPRPVLPPTPAPAKKPTGKKPGGQPGHPPHLKQLLPPERVHHFVHIVPQHCDLCQTALPAAEQEADPPPTRWQVAELPPMAARITEYQAHARTCPGCGTVTAATVPAEVRSHRIGPRLTATLSYLVGAHGVSKRGVQEIADALFDVPIALGSVAHLEQEVSDALAPAYQEAKQAVAEAEVKHLDETGWKQGGKKRWLWLAATTTIAVFFIHPRRSWAALQDLLGGTILRILCSDRWRVYDQWDGDHHQVCWAHLKRNWEKLLERGGESARVGQGCLDVLRQVFDVWHGFRGGGFGRDELTNRMDPLVTKLGEILLEGYASGETRLSRFCERLIDR